MFHPRDKALHTNRNSKTGTRKKSREKSSGNDGTYDLSGIPGSPPFPGIEQVGPGRAPFETPRWPTLTATPVFSLVTPRAAVCSSSGAAAGGQVAVGRAGAPWGVLNPI